ncbi:hypothetical protein J6T66_02820, partial [bacterium]|nr:hypothetical protein [bacterium]
KLISTLSPYIIYMKRKTILLMAAMVIALQSPVSAVTVIDSQIDDELNKQAQQEMVKNTKDLNEKITFTKVNSCESMEKVMGDFLETYKKLHPQRTIRSYEYFATDDAWAVQSATINTIGAK